MSPLYALLVAGFITIVIIIVATWSAVDSNEPGWFIAVPLIVFIAAIIGHVYWTALVLTFKLISNAL